MREIRLQSEAGRLPKNRVAILGAMCISAVTLIAYGATAVPLRYPAAFDEYSPGMVADVYELFRLQTSLKEKPDAPLVFETEHADMARMARYFETAYLVPNIRSRFVMFIGLRDDHTPPFAAATVFNHTSKTMRERKLIVDPWAAHHGRSDLDTYIPRWAEEDKKNGNLP